MKNLNAHLLKIIISIIIFVIIVPFLINLMFKVYLMDFLSAEWNAGDLLTFYGSIIGGVITLLGVVITLDNNAKQTKMDDDVKYRPILRLDSVNGEWNNIMGRRNVGISFPFIALNDDIYENAKREVFHEQMSEVCDFHLIFKNKGRGEATDASFEDVRIYDISWDEKSHLSIDSKQLIIGELLVDESVDLIITFPSYLFLKENQNEYNIFIEFTLSYNNIFHRNKRKVKLLSNFKIIPLKLAVDPYFYKERFRYYQIKTEFVGTTQVEEVH